MASLRENPVSVAKPPTGNCKVEHGKVDRIYIYGLRFRGISGANGYERSAMK